MVGVSARSCERAHPGVGAARFSELRQGGIVALARHGSKTLAYVADEDSGAVLKRIPLGTTFAADMGFANKAGKPMPGVSAFQKHEGMIVRVSASGFNESDEFCPVWRFFDLLPEGPDAWRPKQTYG